MRAAGRIALLLLAGLLVVHFGWRALAACWSAPHYIRGRHLAASANYDEALPELERAAVGALRSEVLWLRAQVRISQWQYAMYEGSDYATEQPLLLDAFREYTEAMSLSPASGWYWSSLGDLYHQRERQQRYEAGKDLGFAIFGPWGNVGRSGRIAVGMMRLSLELEPTWYLMHDQLAFALIDYELQEAALAAVGDSARALPVYRFHAFDQLDPLPVGLLAAFESASRAALGNTPFLRAGLHRLALGRLTLRMDRIEQAEADLRAGLASPGDRLNRAEAHYYLALVLTRQDRPEAADAEYRLAQQHPNFETASLAGRSVLADRRGDPEEALRLLAVARRKAPRRIGYDLEYARIARKIGAWPKAVHALQWAERTHPGDVRPLRALGATYVEMGDLEAARGVLADLEALGGYQGDVERLGAAIERAALR